MYYPFLRGKQFELITVRESASLMAGQMVPIIEPVKSSRSSLRRAIEALVEAEGYFIVIANPRVGDFEANRQLLREELQKDYLADYGNWSVGWVASDLTTEDEIRSAFDLAERVAIIHAGFRSGIELAQILTRTPGVTHHVFLEEATSKLYRRHFTSGERILIRNGFNARRRNADYPQVDHFSDLHITFRDERMAGFGDYLIVGSDYSKSGGPAYAVAIHLTFIDTSEDEDMFVAHYISDSQTSPTDPGGKFAEALQKLVAHVSQPGSPVLHTEAVSEFIQLHQRSHYPGLGYAKKVSMQHHIELMADFLARAD